MQLEKGVFGVHKKGASFFSRTLHQILIFRLKTRKVTARTDVTKKGVYNLRVIIYRSTQDRRFYVLHPPHKQVLERLLAEARLAHSVADKLRKPSLMSTF